jgi:hypothetical protein
MSKPTVYVKQSTCKKYVILLKDIDVYILLNFVVRQFDVAYNF